MPRAALCLAFLLTGALAAPGPATVSGVARVIDGDTLEIRGVRVRLHAVDAPESGQTCRDAGGKLYLCGSKAAFALEALVKGRAVTCTRKDTDRYGRMVAVCTANGVDVNRALVLAGWAVAYTEYGREYVTAEAQAKANRAGLWAGTFQRPSEYRAQKRATTTPSATTRAAPSTPPTPSTPAVPPAYQSSVTVDGVPGTGGTTCPAAFPVKGNVSARGRIYHLPGQGSYAQTKPELCFRTAQAAEQAGFRPAR